MAFDERLADRTRIGPGERKGLSEKTTFGGQRCGAMGRHGDGSWRIAAGEMIGMHGVSSTIASRDV
jgi:hypothetical protein